MNLNELKQKITKDEYLEYNSGDNIILVHSGFLIELINELLNELTLEDIEIEDIEIEGQPEE